MNNGYPERLNLAIANRCFVSCPGCYQVFGRKEPDLKIFNNIISKFVGLGINKVTISGGDPLTLKGLNPFLEDIRKIGVKEIKLDTVGIGLLKHSGKIELDKSKAARLIDLTDFISIPLDGWSNESVGYFRNSNTELFDKICFLLNALDTLTNRQNIIINTVVHKKNIYGLKLIFNEIIKYRCIKYWNVFQYTPTDQVSESVNSFYAIDDRGFYNAKASLANLFNAGNVEWNVQFYSVKSRLGYYLLINSDGEAWLPDKFGKTIRLGKVYGREEDVLSHWRSTVGNMISEKQDLSYLF